MHLVFAFPLPVVSVIAEHKAKKMHRKGKIKASRTMLDILPKHPIFGVVFKGDQATLLRATHLQIRREKNHNWKVSRYGQLCSISIRFAFKLYNLENVNNSFGIMHFGHYQGREEQHTVVKIRGPIIPSV